LIIYNHHHAIGKSSLSEITINLAQILTIFDDTKSFARNGIEECQVGKGRMLGSYCTSMDLLVTLDNDSVELLLVRELRGQTF